MPFALLLKYHRNYDADDDDDYDDDYDYVDDYDVFARGGNGVVAENGVVVVLNNA